VAALGRSVSVGESGGRAASRPGSSAAYSSSRLGRVARSPSHSARSTSARARSKAAISAMAVLRPWSTARPGTDSRSSSVSSRPSRPHHQRTVRRGASPACAAARPGSTATTCRGSSARPLWDCAAAAVTSAPRSRSWPGVAVVASMTSRWCARSPPTTSEMLGTRAGSGMPAARRQAPAVPSSQSPVRLTWTTRRGDVRWAVRCARSGGAPRSGTATSTCWSQPCSASAVPRSRRKPRGPGSDQ
jgi:hypothetical protein